MNSLLKKIWLLFYIIAFIGLITFSSATYLKYNELESRLKNEQRYETQLFNSHIASAFFQFDTMLDLISYEYSFKDDLKIDVIDKILLSNSLLLGVALFNVDGTLKHSSRNLNAINFPNLRTNKKTGSWFEKTLNQPQMTIGHAYYLATLKKWVIPVRKRVTNTQGEVVGVITSGVDLNTILMQWNGSTDSKRTLQATLDRSFYPVLRTMTSPIDYQATYSEAVSPELIKDLKQKVALQKSTLEELRQSGGIIQFRTGQKRGRYASILFNRKLDLWISATESNARLQEKTISQVIIYGTFYLLFLVVIFFLFKWIVRIEKTKMVELTYRVEHDLLTGLYNRSILKNKNLKYHQKNCSFSLLYIDLDHFKGINDSYGYSYGDAILIAVSKRIKEGLKDVNATVVRLSADEFILLIENTDRAQIEAYCHTLLAYINIPYIINNTDFKISASIGIAQSPKDAAAMETLISYANNSMLIAKKTKNNFIFFSERIHQQLIKNIEIEQALQNALSKNEISLVYQPQLNNQGQLYGVEALVRWNNEKLGFIPPGQFIPIAEETGLMPELGAYIMNKAMHEISTLQYKKEKAFQLSINVSARQFAQLNFFEALIECLACYKSPYLEITIEITESLFIENIERLLPIFQKMKDENISLSLDDFGTGYSSLSMLRNVPIDELKIDKSFVDHIADNKNDCAMVSSIITMGKNLGMTVLAEGIENKKQATILQGAGCDLYQGYYFSKPLNLTDLEKYIDTL